MKTASFEVKDELDSLLEESGSGPLVLRRDGHPVAVLYGVHDEDELERLLLAHSPRFQAILEAGERQFRAGRFMSHEQFWKKVEREANAGKKAGGTKPMSGKRGGRKVS